MLQWNSKTLVAALFATGTLFVSAPVMGAEKENAAKEATARERAVGFDASVDEVPFVEGQKPPPAQEGEIWCLVTKPAITRKVTEQAMVRTGTFYYESVPAKYAHKEETVMIEPEKRVAIPVPGVTKKEMVRKMVKPETIDYQVIPAQYEWVDEVVEVTPEKESIVVSDARYKTVTEQVLVEPARTEWKKIDCDEKGVVIHRRESKDDCYHIITIPAKYQTVARQVLDKDLSTDTQRVRGASKSIKIQKVVKEPEIKKVIVPAQYEMVETEVVVTPPTVRYETIPAKYEQVRKLVMVEPEQKQKVEVPPKYEIVTKEIVDQPAMLVWRRKKGDFTPPAPKKEIVEKPAVVERYGSIPGITSEDAEREAKEKEKEKKRKEKEENEPKKKAEKEAKEVK
jgi:hypothetical protein